MNLSRILIRFVPELKLDFADIYTEYKELNHTIALRKNVNRLYWCQLNSGVPIDNHQSDRTGCS
jgi:hypothetical protein